MRATYSPSTCGMHHMSLRQGLRSFSARRRRTVSRERLSCAVSLTSVSASSSSVQAARPRAPPPLQVAFDKAPFGPVDGRPANPDARDDIFVADARVSSKQYLGPL